MPLWRDGAIFSTRQPPRLSRDSGAMSTTIGTPFSETATRVLLCGSGELGKEVVIELQRYGVELLGNCFWREGFEAAFGPDRMGEKGG